MALRHFKAIGSGQSFREFTYQPKDEVVRGVPEPPWIALSLAARVKGGQIADIERDQEHGQTISEVEFPLDGNTLRVRHLGREQAARTQTPNRRLHPAPRSPRHPSRAAVMAQSS